MMNTNIIVYGGTFDPVHKGHLNVIKLISKMFNNSKILVVPNSVPPHKKNKLIAPFYDRVNMLNLCVSNIKNVVVSNVEKDEKVHYTINTLKLIQNEYNTKNISLLIGSDMFLNIEKWYKYTEILNDYEIVVFARNFCDIEKVYCKMQKINAKKITFIKDFILPISSTDIRKDNMYSEDVLPLAVIEYIKQNNLYR